MQAILKGETPRKELDILSGQRFEVIRPFPNEKFGGEDIPAQPRDPVLDLPD